MYLHNLHEGLSLKCFIIEYNLGPVELESEIFPSAVYCSSTRWILLRFFVAQRYFFLLLLCFFSYLKMFIRLKRYRFFLVESDTPVEA